MFIVTYFRNKRLKHQVPVSCRVSKMSACCICVTIKHIAVVSLHGRLLYRIQPVFPHFN